MVCTCTCTCMYNKENRCRQNPIWLLTCENVPTQFDTCTQMLDYNTILSEHIMDYHENHMSVLNQGNWECCTKFCLEFFLSMHVVGRILSVKVMVMTSN